MAAIQEQNKIVLNRAETRLRTMMTMNDIFAPAFVQCMENYRIAAGRVIFYDVSFIERQLVEQKLWETHVRVNDGFKKVLNLYRNATGATDILEYRKVAKQYLSWIKDSQRFYRLFVQTMVDLHGEIPELSALAANQKLTLTSTKNLSAYPETWRHIVHESAHNTLIRLGDLSRWREVHLATKEPQWGPAIGYYDLAGAIHPKDGASHHQLAVIAQHSGSHLGAVYHLYRSLAVECPHPRAHENLEKEFKKILSARREEEFKKVDGQGTDRVMTQNFLLLHARLYKADSFSYSGDLEDEVLSQLAHVLGQQVSESTLSKVVLINIAAQYFAEIRLQGSRNEQEQQNDFSDMNSFLSLLRLNIRTFTALLHILRDEIEGSHVDGNASSDMYTNGQIDEQGRSQVYQNFHKFERLTVITRRILPLCRQYSSWFLSHIELIAAEMANPVLGKDIKTLFEIYAKTLTMLQSAFDGESLPTVDYLVEEDVDTVAFEAFDRERTMRRYHDLESGAWKPGHHVPGSRSHPMLDMLGRIRDLLTDGVEMTMMSETPMDIVNGNTFVYREPSSRVNALARAYLEEVISQHYSSSSSVSSHGNAGMETTEKAATPPKRTFPIWGSRKSGSPDTPVRQRFVDYGPIGTPPKKGNKNTDANMVDPLPSGALPSVKSDFGKA